MPRALATALRRRIVEEHLAGKSLKAIAQQEQLSYSTVRLCWRRYREHGFSGLGPDYQNCGRPQRKDLIYRAARFLKYRHRQWGAPLIRLKLSQRYPDQELPSVRTMQRWFKRAHLIPMRKRLPKPEQAWANAPHDVWQVDAKEKIKLNDGTQACYLTITDEHSGALLASPPFPPEGNQPSGTGNGS